MNLTEVAQSSDLNSRKSLLPLSPCSARDAIGPLRSTSSGSSNSASAPMLTNKSTKQFTTPDVDVGFLNWVQSSIEQFSYQ